MHDATECGIWGGVYELAQAANLGVRLYKDDIVVEDGVFDICRFFGIQDPFAAISEGTLIISCRPHQSESIVNALKSKKIPASIAGELTKSAEGMVVIENGKEQPFQHPGVDPFWNAFYQALNE